MTLLELMVVVTLVGIVAMAAAPSVADALAERRTMETGLDVVRVARTARGEAIGYGRAHLFRYNDAAQEFTVFRGVTNRCNSNDWDAIAGAGCEPTSACRARLRVDDADTLGNDVSVRWQARPGTSVDLCFEPNGKVLWRSGLPRFSDRNIGGPEGALLGGVVFEVRRNEGTNGVTRRIAIPLGGDARVLR